jgi:fibronectin type 3 domain-containing protein
MQNEPDYNATWDSCRFNTTQGSSYPGYSNAFVPLAAKLATLSNPPKLVAPETAGFSQLNNYINAISNKSALYGYGHHLYNSSYGGSGANPDGFITEMTNFASNYPDKPRWMTEYSAGEANYTDAMNLAKLMHNSLTIEKVSSYIYWSLFWTPSGGLVTITTTSWTINPVYWPFKHYSAFIDPNWYRVNASTGTSDLRISAYTSPDSNQLSIVIINTSASTTYSLSLSLNNFPVGDGNIYQTTSTQDCNLIGYYSPSVPLTLPASSITTVALKALSGVPTGPLNLTATAGDSVVWLNWDNNTESDLAGYNVYRSTTSGSGYSKLNTSLLSDSNYIDNSVTNGTPYYYVVTAVDTNNNESRYSMEAKATPSNTRPPEAPTGLSATAGDNIVWLDWNDNNEADFAGYNIYRSTTSGSGYSKLNTSLLGNSDYTDSDAANGPTYYYVVRAVDTASNESNNSNEVPALPSSDVGAMGSILRQWWTGIDGSSVSDLTAIADFPDYPDGMDWVKSLEGPTNWADSYGARISGYLYPPTSGSYTFWIASDDDSELWLSTDSHPENASLIANVYGFTNRRQWDKYPQQQSESVSLTAGQKYYIEVLHKEDSGNDNIAVAWEGPGIAQQVIYGIYLSPWLTGYYGDFTHDGEINMEDFAVLAEAWMQNDCQATSAVDIDNDCIANYTEFSYMLENWLETITPAPPENLSLTANPSVYLDWDDSPELDVIGYNVYRSTTPGGPYTKINSSLVTSSNYSDGTAVAELTYYYVVTAVNIYTNESGYSNEASKIAIQESTTGFCSVDGAIKTDNPGYTGAGYADTSNSIGYGVNWRISVPASSTYTLVWRFDNGTTSNRKAQLMINGSTVISNIDFTGSGAWSNWRYATVDVALTAGTTDIRLEATTSGGLANIDYMIVAGSASLIPVSCSP